MPEIVAGRAPHPWALLGEWLLGRLPSFAGAMAWAELAAARPRAGAEYVYLREAFGRLPGFLRGWTSFVVEQARETLRPGRRLPEGYRVVFGGQFVLLGSHQEHVMRDEGLPPGVARGACVSTRA